MAKPGQPTKFDEKMIKQVVKLCRLGATDKDLANFFDVHVDTIYEWKKTQSAFSEALKKGKEDSDSTIAQSLYHRAKGYKMKEKKFIKVGDEFKELEVETCFPPDTTACIFWLKNRRPDLWRDRNKDQEVPTDIHKHLDELEKKSNE